MSYFMSKCVPAKNNTLLIGLNAAAVVQGNYSSSPSPCKPLLELAPVRTHAGPLGQRRTFYLPGSSIVVHAFTQETV
jgi:hypothetical protein